MRRVSESVASESRDDSGKAPVVTLIGSDFPTAYLDDAEPSPMMESASRMWKRTLRFIRIALVVALVGSYPAAVWFSHSIDDSPVELPKTAAWASAEVGTTLTLLGRELTGAGWTADRSDWHPQARLTALPAWQEGIVGSLSDYTALLSRLNGTSDAGPDEDLGAASRLLAPAGEITATPRLNAAAEALQRYDGRRSRGLAENVTGLDAFDARLALLSDWGNDSHAALRRQADAADGWPAATRDIETVYRARARAHVASQLLLAVLTEEPELVAAPGAIEASDRAFYAWRRAAEFNPMIVTSQRRTGLFMADHPATLAFYMTEAAAATEDLRDAIRTPSDDAVSVAAKG